MTTTEPTTLDPPDHPNLKAVPDLATVTRSQEREIEDLRRQLTNVKNDLHTICERLYEEAEERGWCDEYETFVTEVNARCTQLRLKHRPMEHGIRVNISASIERQHTEEAIHAAIVEAVEGVLADFDADDFEVGIQRQ